MIGSIRTAQQKDLDAAKKRGVESFERDKEILDRVEQTGQIPTYIEGASGRGGFGPTISKEEYDKIEAQRQSETLQMPSQTVLPNTVGLSPTLDSVEKEVARSGNTGAIARAILGKHVLRDPEGRVIGMPPAEAADRAVAQELAASQEAGRPVLNYDFNTGGGLRDQISLPLASSDEYDRVATVGQAINQNSDAIFGPVLNSPEPDAVEFTERMRTLGLLEDPNAPVKRMSNQFANMAAFSLIAVLQNELVKKDAALMEGLDPDDIFLDPFEIAEDTSGADPMSPATEGLKLNPELERSNISNELLNLVDPSINQVAGATTGFGSLPEISSKDKQMLDYLTWGALEAAGMTTVQSGEVGTAREGKRYLELSPAAADFYNKTRGVYDDMHPVKSGLPSLSPNIEGIFLGQERTKGKRKTGNVSGKEVKDNSVERQAMSHKGQMANRLGQYIGPFATMAVNAVIDYTFNSKNKVTLRPRTPLRGMQRGQREFYSDHPLAAMLSLTKKDWTRHYQTAKLKGLADIDALEQANLVMALHARQRANNIHYSGKVEGKTFYQKIFYASANNRYHYRSFTTDPQNSLVMRNILEAADPVLIDTQNQKGEDFEIWQQLIGRALLTPNDLGTTKVEGLEGTLVDRPRNVDDIGFNETLKLTKEKIFNDKVRLETIAQLGRKVRELSMRSDPAAFDAGVRELAEAGHLAELGLHKKDDWGLTINAHIDIANYVDGDKVASLLSMGDVTFRKTPTLAPTTPIDAEGIPTNMRIVELRNQLEHAMEDGNQELAQQLEADLFREQDSIVLEGPVLKTPSTIFRAHVNGKADGKQSGIGVYASMFGVLDLAKHVGLIYSSEKMVIPEGDLRDFFLRKIIPAIKTNYTHDADKQDRMMTLMNAILSDVDSMREIGKELSKSPLMESSYGKWIEFHQETAIKFIEGEFGKPIRDSIDLELMTKVEAVAELAEIIATALYQMLLFEVQDFMKDIGGMWATLGKDAYFTTITGQTVYLGSKEKVMTGQAAQIPTEGGIIELPLKETVDTSTGRTRKVPTVFDLKDLIMTKGDLSPWGQELINQFPVLFIQAADGSLMGLTVNEVNRDRERPLWMIGVHDSIITNVRGWKAYIETYNRLWSDYLMPNGKKRYDPYEATYEPLSKAVQEKIAELKINPNEQILVSPQDHRTRGLWQRLTLLKQIIAEQATFGEDIDDSEDRYRGTGKYKKIYAKQRVRDLEKRWNGADIGDEPATLKGTNQTAFPIKMLTAKQVHNALQLIWDYYQLKARANDLARKRATDSKTLGNSVKLPPRNMG